MEFTKVIEPISVCRSILLCIHEFQTLIAGALAVLAAAVTGYVVWRSANLPLVAQNRHRIATIERRRRHECLLLSSHCRVLHSRARQAVGTIRVHVAANAVVSDDTKDKIYLSAPVVFEDWQVMSLLPAEIVECCLQLKHDLDDHNYDIRRAGGAFGADEFRGLLIRRLENIAASALDLANDLATAAQT